MDEGKKDKYKVNKERTNQVKQNKDKANKGKLSKIWIVKDKVGLKRLEIIYTKKLIWHTHVQMLLNRLKSYLA